MISENCEENVIPQKGVQQMLQLNGQIRIDCKFKVTRHTKVSLNLQSIRRVLR